MKNRITWCMAIVSSIILLGCKNSREMQKEDGEDSLSEFIFVSKEQFNSENMLLGKLEEREFHSVVNCSGFIDVPPQNRANVNTILGGYVKRISLVVGESIEKGDLLCTLESPEFIKLQERYLELRGKLTFLQEEYERQKILMAENITSRRAYLQAESNYLSSFAQFESVKQQLNMLQVSPESVNSGKLLSTIPIYAPIDGSITQINVNRGMYVSPATEMMEIIDNEHIHLELRVFEKDIMKIEVGQHIRFRIPEASEQPYQGEVYLISKTIGENRFIEVHGHLKDTSDHPFLTGMFVNAEIVTISENKLSLPEAAFIKKEGDSYVLKLHEQDPSGYYFEAVLVPTAKEWDGYVPVSGEDLEKDDPILVKGGFKLFP